MSRRLIPNLLTVLACCGIGLLASGCATGESTTTRPSAAATEASAPAEDEAGTEGSELAELAERDVQAFLNRRREVGESESADEPAEPVGEDSSIYWNDPDSTERESHPEITIDSPADVQVELLARKEADPPQVDETKESIAEKAEPEGAIDRDRVRELVVDLSKELYRDAAYADMPLRELLLIAATTMISPDRALVPEAIPGLTQRERELLAEFQSFFTDLGKGLDGSREAEELVLESLEALRQSLHVEPELQIATAVLCTRVGGFGDYDQFDRYAFLAHSEQQAVVYLEIGGFSSEINSQGQWVTELAQQLVIYSDRDGIPVWREDWQSAVDVSRNRRTDFFMVQLITLPSALSVGRYHLKIRLRDEATGTETEQTIAFEMVADPKMAAGQR